MTRPALIGLLTSITLLMAVGCSSAPAALTPPEVPTLSKADLEAQAALDLDRVRVQYLGAFPDAEIPRVDRIRFIELDEWSDVMATCLTEAGFVAVSSPDGGLSSGAPDGQELPYGLAAYTCSAQYPVDPRENVELNADQIRYLYDYYTLVATPCLEKLGFTDLPEPPSQQSYISSYNSGPSWDLYGAVSDQATADEWYEANDLCPQRPPGLSGEPLD